MATTLPIVLASAAARIATGNGSGVDLGALAAVDIVLEVTTVSGTATPTLTVIVQTSSDNATWTELGTFADVLAAGRERLVIANALRYVRVCWEVSGTTPSFTFSVTGSAIQVFATVDDLHQVGVRPVVLEDADPTEVSGALVKRTSFAEGYLSGSGRYTLPLTAWGDDLRLCVAQLAAWDIMTVSVGFDPESAANGNWRDRRDEALAWLRDIAAGKIAPIGVVDSTPTVTGSRVAIRSNRLRGWGCL